MLINIYIYIYVAPPLNLPSACVWGSLLTHPSGPHNRDPPDGHQSRVLAPIRVRIRPEQLPLRANKKLHPQTVSKFQKSLAPMLSRPKPDYCKDLRLGA